MRATDPLTSPAQPRTERFHQHGGAWFFRTREGIQVGGFPSLFDAELAACLLITRLAQSESDAESRQAMNLFLHAPPVAFTGTPAPPAAGTRTQAARPRWQFGDSLRRWLEPEPLRTS